MPSQERTGRQPQQPSTRPLWETTWFFRPTKITPGGTRRITKIVRGFVLIQQDTGEKLQRAPHNVQLIWRPDQRPESSTKQHDEGAGKIRRTPHRKTITEPTTTTHLETTAVATTANKATVGGEATTAPPETARAVFAATQQR